jgi:hypothetical protein
MVCSAILAGNVIYVNGDSGEDVFADGLPTSAGIPYKTIDAAYRAASDGDTIRLEEAVYDDATQGWGWSIVLDRNPDIGVTIESDSTPVILNFSDSIGIQFLTSGNTVSLRNLVILHGGFGSNDYIVLMGTDETGILQFQNCQINQMGSTYHAFMFLPGQGNTGTLAFNGCTVNVTCTLSPFMIKNMNLLEIVDSSLSSTAVTTMLESGWFGVAGSFGGIKAVNSTFLPYENQGLEKNHAQIMTINDNTNENLFEYILFDTCTMTSNLAGINIKNILNEQGKVDIRNCTIHSNGDGTALLFGDDYNSLMDWSAGAAYTEGVIRTNDGYTFVCTSSHTSNNANEPRVGAEWRTVWKMAKGPHVKLINNVVSKSANATGHMILIGEGCTNAEISGNFVRTGTRKHILDYGLVNKGEASYIHHNTLYGARPLFLGLKNHNIVENNTVYSTYSTALRLGDDQGSGDGVFTNQNRIINNIFYATQSYCLSFTDNTVDNCDEIDYNCYFRSDGGAIFFMNNTALNTLSEVRDTWPFFSFLYGQNNDQHSIVVNPSFDSNYQPQNIQLKNAGSPVLTSFDGASVQHADIGARTFKDAYIALPSDCIHPPSMDYNNDCKIDMIDLSELAFEWMYSGLQECVNPLSMDANRDCKVDATDFIEFTSQWMILDSQDCISPPSMDFNGDCNVDLLDFSEFASQWMVCGLSFQSACWE